ncbi:MAG: pyrroline-5-carboxylate reductase [Propioniciclava sp.]|uniref:pyrroline-5-carboxylate reductase n=1 Tax=Propioniciclava sp. TaxID=2038686 RepID=UPI0039E5E005
MSRVAVIGTGMMGEALMAGMLAAGWAPADIVGADRRAERCRELEQKYGIATATDSAAAVEGAAVVLILVKPQDVGSVLPEIGPQLADGAVVVSLCAGVTLATLQAGLPAGTPVVRVMPNTPALVGQGMAALSPGEAVTDEQLARAVHILEAVGKAVVVPERYQDAVTAISGSGPAYVFYIAEALADAGVLLGLPRDTAVTLANQTLLGGATMLAQSDDHAAVLRERVTSPAGTTAAALRTLEDRAVKAAFLAAAEAARDRSLELGRG